MATKTAIELKENDSIKIQGRYQRVHEVKTIKNETSIVYGGGWDKPEKTHTFNNEEVLKINPTTKK